MSLNQLRVF